MNVALTPDTYVPGVSENGVYVDVLPSSIPVCGLKCPCFDRYYSNRDKFVQHIKCKRHTEWMKQLNLDKHNFFKKCVELEQTVRQQRLLIAELENKSRRVHVENLIDL